MFGIDHPVYFLRKHFLNIEIKFQREGEGLNTQTPHRLCTPLYLICICLKCSCLMANALMHTRDDYSDMVMTTLSDDCEIICTSLLPTTV